MNSASLAVPLFRQPLLTPPCCSADASLAGTCGAVMGLRPLPHRPTSARLNQDDKPSETQAVRKSVSFSLRARGPGPSYNSPSPQQQQPTTQQSQTNTHQDDSERTSLDSGEDVVRRLFRAVQGHACSPEPRPKAYPGWLPQLQQPRSVTLPADTESVLHPPPEAGGPTALTDCNQTSFTLWTSTTQDIGVDASVPDGFESSSPSLDAHALARVRLALSCASRVHEPSPPALLQHGISGRPAGTLRVDSTRGLESLRSQSPLWTSSRPDTAAPQRLKVQPQPDSYRAPRAQHPARRVATAADVKAAAAKVVPGHWPLPAPGVVAAAAFRDLRPSAPPGQRVANRNGSPQRPPLRTHAVMWPGRVPSRPTPAEQKPDTPPQGTRPQPPKTTIATSTCISVQPPMAAAAAPESPPAIAKLSGTSTTGISACVGTATGAVGSAVATPESPRAPAGNQMAARAANPFSTDENVEGVHPHATFAHVHMLLASLNLPGVNAPDSNRQCDPYDDSKNDGSVFKQSGPPPGSVQQMIERLPESPRGLSTWPYRPAPTQATQHSSPRQSAWSEIDRGHVKPARHPESCASKSLGSSELSTVKKRGSPARSLLYGSRSIAIRWSFDETLAAYISPGGVRPGGAQAAAERRDAEGEAAECDGFSWTLRPAVCCAWLRSVGRLVAANRQVAVEELGRLVRQLREASLERRHVEAYLLALRLCVAGPRLTQLHKLDERLRRSHWAG